MILIVDDHRDNAELLQRLLRTRGYASATAHDGQEALAYLRAAATAPAGPPDLVILDDMMPGLSGLDVLRVARDDLRLHSLPVIFFSASHDAARQSEARALGARDWLVKGSDTWQALLQHVAELSEPDAPTETS